MLKAVAGGGGRGMRPVTSPADLDQAFARAASEARGAFGSGDLYVEELMTRARHVEVQIVGDGTGAVAHLWDRECSLQRQRQKLIEIAPAFGLPEAMRAAMLQAAVTLGAAVRYRGVGTVEFLVDARPGAAPRFAFIEANARLQVEHTVTETVLGRDLVAVQLKIADGADLARARADAGQRAGPAGRGPAGAGEPGVDDRRRLGPAGRRRAVGLRPALRAGRARRRLRVRRLRDLRRATTRCWPR